MEQVRQESVYVEMALPIIPPIGGEIEIPFIQGTENFSEGNA